MLFETADATELLVDPIRRSDGGLDALGDAKRELHRKNGHGGQRNQERGRRKSAHDRHSPPSGKRVWTAGAKPRG